MTGISEFQNKNESTASVPVPLFVIVMQYWSVQVVAKVNLLVLRYKKASQSHVPSLGDFVLHHGRFVTFQRENYCILTLA